MWGVRGEKISKRNKRRRCRSRSKSRNRRRGRGKESGGGLITLDFGCIRGRLAHEQRRGLAVQRVSRVGVQQQLRQEDFKHVDEVCVVMMGGGGEGGWFVVVVATVVVCGDRRGGAEGEERTAVGAGGRRRGGGCAGKGARLVRIRHRRAGLEWRGGEGAGRERSAAGTGEGDGATGAGWGWGRQLVSPPAAAAAALLSRGLLGRTAHTLFHVSA